jgi:hypothetical protein
MPVGAPDFVFGFQIWKDREHFIGNTDFTYSRLLQ